MGLTYNPVWCIIICREGCDLIMNINNNDSLFNSIGNLFKGFDEIVNTSNQDLLQENANMDGRSPMGQMSKFGSESSKFFARQQLLSDEAKQAVDDNYIHIHDFDYMAMGTTTCNQIPLGKLLERGFDTGHGFIRQPTSIRSAMALASIILQSNQNMQHGGQAYPMFDYDLAPYVKMTFDTVHERIKAYPTTYTDEEMVEVAWEETDEITYQACEAFIHNSNSMHSRGGSQVPFVSVNYGTDISKEGRMIVRNLLKATKAGLGNGETPIFPIQIFKVKKGLNFDEDDVNYDLYQLALETTAERLFPNFSFVDAPFNLQHYDGTPESEIAYMGCRTRVMSNRHGDENSIGRGNLSFTSINLVKMALVADGDVHKFFGLLNTYVDIVTRQLYERFVYQGSKLAKDFSFLYSQGVWEGSEALNPDDTLEEVLKQGTLSLGFIGLAEALVALIGEHHGESEEAHDLGVKIVRFMRDRMDEAADSYDLNYSLIATPAEGLSGRFTKRDKEEFGVIEGVTEHAFYTNSFHIPVYHDILAINKIKAEGVFHELCNAGHISYIECDGNMMNNTKALDQLVRQMYLSGMGYGSINHPVDRCAKCDFSGVINNECPSCLTDDENDIIRIRRITGYLVGDMTKWNTSKQEEEKKRVKHM